MYPGFGKMYPGIGGFSRNNTPMKCAYCALFMKKTDPKSAFTAISCPIARG
jgi:ribosomal protein S27E